MSESSGRLTDAPGPPQEVGRTHCIIGLVMSAAPIVFGWLAPYAGVWCQATWPTS
jgi:hypothetical protein